MTRVLVVALAAMLPALAAAQNHIRCQNTIGGPCGDSSRPREYNCCDYGYCQPWNSGYYQCLDKPERCPNQETDIDYYGNDIRTVVGVQPSQCCDACYDTAGCTAYTFVNENPDGKTRCYLKSASTGRVEKKGAVSAAVNKTLACGAVGSGCGNSGGASCCVDGAYCQPWNGGYYQCLSTPSKCPNQETDIDYYGNDLKTLYNLSPSGCCDTCGSTPGCAAYTFVNENADGRTACYLKSSADGRVAKKGAVSAKNKDFVPSTCPNKLGSQCGNAQTGPGCCPSGTYCQPWNQWYYQCIALPPSEKCTDIKIGVDYYGDDLRVGYNIPPDWCCNNCFLDPECKAYTYVNENENGQSACYMKTGKGETRSNPKAISGSSAPKTA